MKGRETINQIGSFATFEAHEPKINQFGGHAWGLMAEEFINQKGLWSYLRENIPIIVPLGFYSAWVFTLILNRSYFNTSYDVLEAIRCMGIVEICLLIAVCILVFLGKGIRRSIEKYPIFLIIAFFGCAALSCMLETFSFGLVSGGLLASALQSMLIATSLFAYSIECYFISRDRSFAEALRLFVFSFTCALIVFLVLNLLVSEGFLLTVLGLCLVGSAFLLAGNKKQSGTCRQTIASTTKADAADPIRKRGKTSFESYWRFGAKSPLLIGLILFLAGFLFMYELSAMQKTTHYQSLLSHPVIVGQTSLASILYICLFLFLAIVFLREARKPSMTLAGITIALLLICTYYCLPIMASQSFPVSFILIQAIASAMLLSMMLLFIEALNRKCAGSVALRDFATGIGIVSCGGLFGTAVAYVLMANLQTMVFMDEILSILPAVLLFVIIVLMILSRKTLMPLVGNRAFDRKLDTSLIEDRCMLLSHEFGLTKREQEVLILLSQGKNVPAIAKKLFISSSTAKTHVLHIYKKSGVSSRQELLEMLYESASSRN